jgi:predicted peptidase
MEEIDVMTSWNGNIIAGPTTFIAFLAISACGCAEPSPVKVSRKDFEAHRITDSAGSVMSYRLFVPRNIDLGQRYPLVVFLHGKSRK